MRSEYRKVASSNTSRLEAHAGFFRLLMKGFFYPYVLWPFDKKLISELVTRVRTRDYTVGVIWKLCGISLYGSVQYLYIVKYRFNLQILIPKLFTENILILITMFSIKKYIQIYWYFQLISLADSCFINWIIVEAFVVACSLFKIKVLLNKALPSDIGVIWKLWEMSL